MYHINYFTHQAKFKRLTFALASISITTLSQSGQAQNTMSSNAMERSRWYTAPREIHIVDERPVVRDFREAPSNAGQIAIPNGPGGGMGAGGMGGIGGGSGVNPVIPSGGLPIGGNAPAYRETSPGISTLPKSGFGGSNIPAHGLGPRGILPGVATGVVGKVMSQNKPRQTAVAPTRATGVRGPSGAGVSSGPPAVSSYGGYGNAPVTNYGNSSRAEQNVRGHLLRGR